jgi:hypothetical protein
MRRADPTFHLALRFPKVDLNDPRQRRVAKKLFAGLILFLPILGVSSYHGYHYTDSTEFCAKACHAVMDPQATAFESSSHARVACAECHIGSGASWFVKSKLSGTRQVLAVLSNSYSRPIPPAIKHLRPASDTCEQCHWPNKFFGAQLREIPVFRSDEENSRADVRMLVNTGGADVATGRSEGIHKHMLMMGKIEYIAIDDRLQDIPWVRWVDPLGEELIYRSDGLSAADPRPEGPLRGMDCMDCHNRPAHKFRSPNVAVNLFLESGRIDTTLPFIKREAVAALSRQYPDSETARLQLVNRIIEFYRTKYPQRYDTDRASVRQAADAVADIYRENMFPYMKVDWRTYPDNIGHLESPGCFRCHDGKHVNQYGALISHECGVCHTFLNAVTTDDGRSLISEGEFIHSYPLEGTHATLRCDQCHTGGPDPDPTCAGCHTRQRDLFEGTVTKLAEFGITPSPMAGVVDCDGCHDLAEPLSIASVDALCLDCHDDDEEYVGMLQRWNNDASVAQAAAAKTLADVEAWVSSQTAVDVGDAHAWLNKHRVALDTVMKAGPLHNPEAAHAVFNAIINGGEQWLGKIEGTNP